MTWVRLIGCSLVFIFRCGLWFLMRQGKHLGILSSIFCQSILEACISQALRGIHGKTPYPLLVQRHRHFRASPQIHLLGIYMFSFSVWFVVWFVVRWCGVNLQAMRLGALSYCLASCMHRLTSSRHYTFAHISFQQLVNPRESYTL